MENTENPTNVARAKSIVEGLIDTDPHVAAPYAGELAERVVAALDEVGLIRFDKTIRPSPAPAPEVVVDVDEAGQ